MKRPKIIRSKLLLFGPVLLVVALGPTLLTGFVATPGQKIAAPNDGPTTNIEALMKSVMKLNEKKQSEKAIEMLLSSFEKEGEASLMRTLLVQTFDLFLEEEIRRAQKDLEHNRKNKSAYSRMAGALELLGDNFRSMEVLLSGINYLPKNTDLWMKIGKLELKAKREMEALDVFKEIIRLDAKNCGALNNAAYILARSDSVNTLDLEIAEKFASTARKLDPKNTEYLDTLAEVNFRQGDLKTAKSLIEEALKLAPNKQALKNQLQRFSHGQSFIPE